MNTTVEIDKAGRIVIPKKMREALHLTPGSRLAIEQHGDNLALRPALTEGRLVIENGVPLIFPAEGSNPPAVSTELVDSLIAQGRREREGRLTTAEGEGE